jgi:pSer/pThr/pTyr-binding forkhead associated (FHA) protein
MSPNVSRLIVRTGPNPGMVFDLTKEITTIGRDVANDIVLGDPEVSRQHARLTRTPGGYVLEDLGSTNGSFVNGERLSSPRVLDPGDLLGMSEKVTLTFEMAVPEGADTVMSPVAETKTAEVQAEPASPEPYSPAVDAAAPQVAQPSPEPPPVQPGMAEPKRKRSPWIAAGFGCLVVLAILIAILVYMDANYPCILYAPFRFMGFEIPGCQ